MKAISVIVVSYNWSEQVIACLDSILAQDFQDYELTIVDNSPEGIVNAALRTRYPNALLIENRKNYGYCKALNQGIKQSSGRFILCLNDDVTLQANFISSVYAAIEQDKKIGAVQPKVLKPDRRHIDTAGIFLSGFRRFYDIGSGKLDGELFDRPRFVFGACDAAVLYRKEALDDIKQGQEYFDEDFFCIVEDVDLSWRMQKKGWRTLYYPQAACVHKGGISRKKGPFRQYLVLRNRYLMLLKNESLPGFLRFPFIFLFYDLWRNLGMLITNPLFFLKANYELFRLSGRMLGKRKLAKHEKRV